MNGNALIGNGKIYQKTYAERNRNNHLIELGHCGSVKLGTAILFHFDEKLT